MKTKIQNILTYLDKRIHFSTRENVSTILYLFFKRIDKPLKLKQIYFETRRSGNFSSPPFFCISLEQFFGESFYLDIGTFDEDSITKKNKKVLDKVIEDYRTSTQEDFFALCADDYHSHLPIGYVLNCDDIYNFHHSDKQSKQKP